MLLFIHIPKAAGSSINKLFIDYFGRSKAIEHCNQPRYRGVDFTIFDYVSGHVCWPIMKEHLGNKNFYSFAILRDPLDHMVSHLNWVKRLSLPEFKSDYDAHDDKIKSVVSELKNIDLTSFNEIKKYLSNLKDHAKKLFINGQSRYFLPPNLHGITSSQNAFDYAFKSFFEINFVGTLESIEKSIQKIAYDNKLTINKIPKVNININKVPIEFTDNEKEFLYGFVPIDAALYSLALRNIN